MSGVNNYNNPGYEYFNFLNNKKISKKAKDKETENNPETQDKAEAKTEKSALDKIKEKVKARNAGTTSQEEQKIDSGVVSYNIALNYNNSYNNLNFKKDRTTLIMDSSNNSAEAETQTKAKAEQTQGETASGTRTGEVIVNDSSKNFVSGAPEKQDKLQSTNQVAGAQDQGDKTEIQKKKSSLQEIKNKLKNGQTSYDTFKNQVEGEYNANAEQVVNQQNAFNQDVKQKQETFNQKVEQEHKANNEEVKQNYVDAQNKYTVVNDELLRKNGVQEGDTVIYDSVTGCLEYSSPDGTRSGVITLSRFKVECKDFNIEGLPEQPQIPTEQPTVAETPAKKPQPTVTQSVTETGDSAAQQPDTQEETTQETETEDVSDEMEKDWTMQEIHEAENAPKPESCPEGVHPAAIKVDGGWELDVTDKSGDYVVKYTVNDNKEVEIKGYSVDQSGKEVELKETPDCLKDFLPTDSKSRSWGDVTGIDPSVRPGESVVIGYKTPDNVNIVTNQVGNNTQKTQTPDAATTKDSNNGGSDIKVQRFVDEDGKASQLWTENTEKGTVNTQIIGGRKHTIEKDSDGNVVRVTDEYADGRVDVYKPNENGELERDLAEMLDAGYDNLIEEGLSDINSLKSNETNTATPRKDGLASDEEIIAWVNDIINDPSRDQAATVNLPIQPKEQAEASKKESEERQKAEAARQKAELERQKQQNLSWSNNNRGYFNTTLGDGGINDFASNNVTFDFFGNAQYSTFGQNISYYAMDDYSNMITRVRGSGNGGYGPHLA